MRELLAAMPKRVEIDSEWFIVSMTWIKKWEVFVGFEEGSEPQLDKKPGKIDNSDIIFEFSRDPKTGFP